jgi:hypothetical protein
MALYATDGVLFYKLIRDGRRVAVGYTAARIKCWCAQPSICQGIKTAYGIAKLTGYRLE